MAQTARRSWLRSAATGLMALMIAAAAQAATTTITVDSTAQEVPFVTNGNCTLGEAIRAANTDAAIDNCTDANFDSGGPFVIELAATTYTLSQSENSTFGPTGLPEITSDITINGNGAIVERSAAMAIPALTVAFSARLAMFRRRSTKRSTIEVRTPQPRWLDSCNEVSGKPGTTQTGTLEQSPNAGNENVRRPGRDQGVQLGRKVVPRGFEPDKISRKQRKSRAANRQEPPSTDTNCPPGGQLRKR